MGQHQAWAWGYWVPTECWTPLVCTDERKYTIRYQQLSKEPGGSWYTLLALPGSVCPLHVLTRLLGALENRMLESQVGRELWVLWPNLCSSRTHRSGCPGPFQKGLEISKMIPQPLWTSRTNHPHKKNCFLQLLQHWCAVVGRLQKAKATEVECCNPASVSWVGCCLWR